MTQRGARAYCALLCSSFALAIPVRATAQEQEAPVGKVAKPLRAGPLTGVPAWSLDFLASHTDDSNVTFQAPPGAVGDQLERVSANLAYTASARWTEFTLSGLGSGIFHREVTELNSFDYGGSLAVSHRLSRRTNLVLRDVISRRYTGDQQSLSSEGLLLPLSRSLTNGASLGLEASFSARTTGSLVARHDLAQFDDPSLSDGTTLSAETGLRRRVGKVDSVSALYTLVHSTTQGQAVNIHSALMGWTGARGRHWLGELNAGASTLRQGSSSELFITPVGAVGLMGRLSTQALGLRLSREVDQAFGLGRQRTVNLVSGVYTGDFGRLNLLAQASGSVSKDVADSSFRLGSHALAAQARWSIRRNFDVAAVYSERETSEGEAGPPTRSRVFSVAIGYGIEWGARRSKAPTEPSAGSGSSSEPQ